MIRTRVTAAVSGLIVSCSLLAQPLQLLVLNGRTGKPVPKEQLLLFRNGKFEGLDGSHDILSYETDANGYLAIEVAPDRVKTIELSIDWHRPCTQMRPSYLVEEVLVSGVVSKDTCKAKLIRRKPSPGTFVLYVRDETFLEKMAY